jgi:hypothetical protein
VTHFLPIPPPPSRPGTPEYATFMGTIDAFGTLQTRGVGVLLRPPAEARDLEGDFL